MQRPLRHALHGLALVLVWALVLTLAPLGQASAARTSKGAKAAATRRLHAIVHREGIRAVAVKKSVLERHETTYSLKVPQTPIRDQKQSGRCWVYSFTKTLLSIAARHGVEVDALSGSFLNYHALRRIAHAAIDQGRRNNDRPDFNSDYLGAEMTAEGGHAEWANEIVLRHGVVPADKMRSSFDSRESGLLQNQLHRLVAAAYAKLGSVPPEATRQRQQIARSYKHKVDALLDMTIGAPPRRFTVDGKTYSPRSYRDEYLKLEREDLDFVVLSHDPTRAFNRRYRDLGAVKGFSDRETYNVSMETLQQAVKRSLREGIVAEVSVNIDSDNPHRVAQRTARSGKGNGVLSQSALDYDRVLPKIKLTKAQRMKYGVSLSNHSMSITGHEPKRRGKQARWQIDNSHGDKLYRNGRFDMYDDFFKQYVEEVTVPRSAVSKSLLSQIEGKPVLDTLADLNIAPSRGGETWTPRRKAALVKALLAESLTIDEAAQRYKLPAAKILAWRTQADKALRASLR